MSNMPGSMPNITDDEIAELNGLQDAIANAKGTLLYALQAGELLIKAKLEAQRTGTTFKFWLETNCPEIGESTARLYMRFHNQRTTLEQRAGGANALADLGVRQARELLESEKTKATKAAAKEKAKEKRSQEKALVKVAKEGRSVDLATMIQAEPSPDVIAKAIKDAGVEGAGLREIANILDETGPDLRTLLKEADPDEVIEAFDPDDWDAEELDQIADGITSLAADMRKQGGPSAPAPDKPEEKPSRRA